MLCHIIFNLVVNRMLHRLPSCYHDNDLPERRTSLHRELAAALSSKQVSSNTLLEAWMSSPSYTPPPSPVTSKPISNLWAHTLSAIKETEASKYLHAQLLVLSLVFATKRSDNFY